MGSSALFTTLQFELRRDTQRISNTHSFFLARNAMCEAEAYHSLSDRRVAIRSTTVYSPRFLLGLAQSVVWSLARSARVIDQCVPFQAFQRSARLTTVFEALSVLRGACMSFRALRRSAQLSTIIFTPRSRRGRRAHRTIYSPLSSK